MTVSATMGETVIEVDHHLPDARTSNSNHTLLLPKTGPHWTPGLLETSVSHQWRVPHYNANRGGLLRLQFFKLTITCSEFSKTKVIKSGPFVSKDSTLTQISNVE